FASGQMESWLSRFDVVGPKVRKTVHIEDQRQHMDVAESNELAPTNFWPSNRAAGDRRIPMRPAAYQPFSSSEFVNLSVPNQRPNEALNWSSSAAPGRISQRPSWPTVSTDPAPTRETPTNWNQIVAQSQTAQPQQTAPVDDVVPTFGGRQEERRL